MPFSPPPYLLRIPTDDIEFDPATGYETACLDGDRRRVAYHADSDSWWTVVGSKLDRPVWRTAPGCWCTGSDEAFLARPSVPSARRTLALPPVPSIAPDAAPIPRSIHYFWIGETGMPEALVENIALNVARSGRHASVVHVHAQTSSGTALLREQVRRTGAALNDLRDDATFEDFLHSPLASYYRRFLLEPTRNYGAASDMLRVYFLHRLGGIYMDCDDTIAAPFPDDGELLAAPDDVLVNNMITIAHVGFHGYNQNNFACHAGNRVLARMLEEMATRLGQADDFLSQPRPWRSQVDPDDIASVEAMELYILRTLHLTGPGLFSNVLCQLRPDYYAIERALLYAYEQTTHSPSEPRYVVDDYMNRMHAALAHYVPFAQPGFTIQIGNADSWNRLSGIKPYR